MHKSSINYELKRNRGKAQLIFLPDPDYGALGAGGMIPPKAILVFDVELVNVKNRTAIHFGWL